MISRYKTILIFYVLALLVGALTGAVGSLFQMAIHWVSRFLSYIYTTIALLHIGIPSFVCSAFMTLMCVWIAWMLVRQ